MAALPVPKNRHQFAAIPEEEIWLTKQKSPGSDRRVTLFNCFVMGDIADDLGSIFDHLRDAALTMQQGGGIGCRRPAATFDVHPATIYRVIEP